MTEAPPPDGQAVPVWVSGKDKAEGMRRFRKRERVIQDALDDYRRFLDELADKYDVLFAPWLYDPSEGVFRGRPGSPPIAGPAPPPPPSRRGGP